MPFLNLKVSGSHGADTTARLAGILTELTGEGLGKKRELTAVAIEYVPREQWFVGSVTLASKRSTGFYLDIKVTEGTNTKDEKVEYIGKVFAALEAVLGKIEPASYIVIHEVRADAWGYQGASQEFRYIDGRRSARARSTYQDRDAVVAA